MSCDVRPASMERIVNESLAKAFIDEQVALIREQVGDKKVLLALSGGVDHSLSPDGDITHSDMSIIFRELSSNL